MTRRSFIGSACTATALAASASARFSEPSTKLGIASTSYMTVWRPKDTYELLEHCHAIGAAGIQAPLNGDLLKIRAAAENWGMYVEAMVSLPKDGETAAFERALQNAKQAGALALRAGYLSGRRYETFPSLAEWQKFVSLAHQSLKQAVPLLDRHKIPLGLENHKDWTADELVAIMKSYSSEYLGVCLDFGNNVSLLDDPMDVTEKLAPYVVSTHLKDMGVEPFEDGFLLSEVRLGGGFLDLPKMVSLVREARPHTRFSLEMITRDPLPVPCLTDRYWVTFPDRNGAFLARTLRLVNQKKQSSPLPRISQLPRDAQQQLEEDNVKACLTYSTQLNLG